MAGLLKGRRIPVPMSRRGEVRPTADRVREAMFSILGDLDGATVLDLYCGSGALGIEAVSRGAREAILVDRDPDVVATVRGTLDGLGLSDRARVVHSDVAAFLAGSGGPAADVVLADPPYRDDPGPLVREILESGRIGPGSRILVERERRRGPGPIPPLRTYDYGDSSLDLYRKRTG